MKHNPLTSQQFKQFITTHYTPVVWLICILHLIVFPFTILMIGCYMVVAMLNYILVIRPCELCDIPIPKWSQKIDNLLNVK